MGTQPGKGGDEPVLRDPVKLQKDLLWGDYLELRTQM